MPLAQTQAAILSDDGNTVVCQVDYRLNSWQNKSAYQGNIDIYDPDFIKVASYVMTTDDLKAGAHTIQMIMPSSQNSGEYTFVVSAQDDDAAVNKDHSRRWACQVAPRTIYYLNISGTNAHDTIVSFTKEDSLVSMTLNMLQVDGNAGTTVWSDTWAGSILPLFFKTFAWDTTHFADGTNIRFKLTGQYASGAQRTTNIYYRVYNKAYSLGNQFETIGVVNAHQADSAMKAMNHNTQISYTDAKTTILHNIPDFTTFFICTHGAAGAFLDCATKNGLSVPPQSILNALKDPDLHTDSVADAVKRKVGHYHKAPDYNFVFIDGCKCGSDDEFAKAFNVAGGLLLPKDDCAFLGWKVSIKDTPGHDRWVKSFYDAVGKGKTVQEAVEIADSLHILEGRDDNNKNVSSKHIEFHRIIGDTKTKLHGVYLGKDATQWHIP